MPQSSGLLALAHLAARGEQALDRRMQLEVGGMSVRRLAISFSFGSGTAVSAGWRQSTPM